MSHLNLGAGGSGVRRARFLILFFFYEGILFFSSILNVTERATAFDRVLDAERPGRFRRRCPKGLRGRAFVDHVACLTAGNAG